MVWSVCSSIGFQIHACIPGFGPEPLIRARIAEGVIKPYFCHCSGLLLWHSRFWPFSWINGWGVKSAKLALKDNTFSKGFQVLSGKVRTTVAIGQYWYVLDIPNVSVCVRLSDFWDLDDRKFIRSSDNVLTHSKIALFLRLWECQNFKPIERRTFGDGSLLTPITWPWPLLSSSLELHVEYVERHAISHSERCRDVE